MGVKCLAQEHNTVPRPGLEPGPFDPESSALTIRPPRLPLLKRPSSKHVSLIQCKFVKLPPPFDNGVMEVAKHHPFISYFHFKMLVLKFFSFS